MWGDEVVLACGWFRRSLEVGFSSGGGASELGFSGGYGTNNSEKWF